MAGELEYQYRTPDANTSANPTGGTVVTTTPSMTGGSFYGVNVTGFPASLVIQPGDLIYRADNNYLVATARVALNGSGAGRVYGVKVFTATWTAAQTLEIRRPLPSAIADYFTKGGIIVPSVGGFLTAAPIFDLYMQPTPETALNLYIVVDCRVRGLFGATPGQLHQLLLRNWADTSTIETFDWSATYADSYGEDFATDGGWAEFSLIAQVTTPSALTDWRYKAKITHTSTTIDAQVMYVGAVAMYWSEAEIGAFRWSYQGGCHKAHDYANDLLFDSAEPLTYHRVRALEWDPTKPYALGAECDLRDGATRSTPRVVSVRRTLEARSTDLPLPEIELNNRPPTLTRQLVAKGSL